MTKWIIIGIVVAIVLILLYGVSIYNKLVVLRNRVRDQWAQIDVQLKRRFDLIPNLVETVKGYAKHESETLEQVIKARNTFLNASTPEAEMAADGELTKAMTKLFALAESYPDLKANTNFTDLQKELELETAGMYVGDYVPNFYDWYVFNSINNSITNSIQSNVTAVTTARANSSISSGSGFGGGFSSGGGFGGGGGGGRGF